MRRTDWVLGEPRVLSPKRTRVPASPPACSGSYAFRMVRSIQISSLRSPRDSDLCFRERFNKPGLRVPFGDLGKGRTLNVSFLSGAS